MLQVSEAPCVRDGSKLSGFESQFPMAVFFPPRVGMVFTLLIDARVTRRWSDCLEREPALRGYGKPIDVEERKGKRAGGGAAKTTKQKPGSKGLKKNKKIRKSGTKRRLGRRRGPRGTRRASRGMRRGGGRGGGGGGGGGGGEGGRGDIWTSSSQNGDGSMGGGRLFSAFFEAAPRNDDLGRLGETGPARRFQGL